MKASITLKAITTAEKTTQTGTQVITTYQITGNNGNTYTGTQIDGGRVYWRDSNGQPCGSTRNGQGYEIIRRLVSNLQEAQCN